MAILQCSIVAMSIEPMEGEPEIEAPDAAEADVGIMRRDLSQVLVNTDPEALSDTETVKQVAEMTRLAFALGADEPTLAGAIASRASISRRNAILPHIADNLRAGRQRHRPPCQAED